MDQLYGRAGDDRIFGGDDGDRLWGGKGHDRLWGARGRDVVVGRFGDDRVFGGAGDDLCVSTVDEQPGGYVDGGPGHDVGSGDAGDTLVSVEDAGTQLCFGG
jgi:Ca2+-binding RTX toxin-like protein